MLKNSSECASSTQHPAITAGGILNDLILITDLSEMRQHLRVMADSYLLTEDEANYRQRVFTSYMDLDCFLSKMEILSRKQQERRVSC